ncbi:MAG: RagB/SusD family nutrient uptake outer membrane protein [Kofleriaceae bacterium]
MKNLLFGLTTVAALHLAACDFDIPDLNNPGLAELESSPTRPLVTVACTGLLDGHRAGLASANGYIVQLGILGREAYNFDPADPRFIGELLTAQLQKGSPFGGNFWAGPYANIRLANLVVSAADKVPTYTAMERSAIKGFARTMIASDLLRVINTHDTNGAVIDTDKPLGQPLGAIVGKDAVFAKIVELLDQAKTDLGAAGDEFPFPLTTGFAGFDDPAGFLQYNRALRARVALYVDQPADALTALGESFLNAAPASLDELNAGPVLNYSPASGDTANALTNRNIFAHPSLVTAAQTGDARVTRKLVMVAVGSSSGLMSDRKFLFDGAPPTRSTSIPLIRNEELILIRAEAEAKLGMKTEAIADLNTIRDKSAQLAALANDIPDAQVTDEILYNRRYSLMFEGGHSWIDARRFGRITSLPKDLPDHVYNVRYPIPQAECDGRPNEPACNLGSQ